MATYAVPTRVGFFSFGVLFGKPSAIPLKSPSQLLFHGQMLHFGFRGVHIVAPKSMTA